MRVRSVYALIHQDVRASVMPLAGSAMILTCAIALSIILGDSMLPPLQSPVWALFGMVMGSGLFARDRRSGSAAFFGSLPIHPATLASVRFVFRLMVALIFTAGYILLKYKYDMTFWADAQSGLTDRIAAANVARFHKDFPGVLREAFLGTWLGLTVAAAFSSTVRRESVAFGATFFTFLVALILFFGVVMVHPRFLLLQLAMTKYQWVWTALAIIGGLIALFRGIMAREPEQGQALRRVVLPLIITLVFGTVLFAASPSYLLRTPIEEMTAIRSVCPLTGTQDVLVDVAREEAHRVFSMGIWRIGTDGNRRIVDPEQHGVLCSPNGRYVMSWRRSRYLWEHWKQYAEIRDVSGNLIRSDVTGPPSTTLGKWSPDDQWCAIPADSPSECGVKLIPSSAQTSSIYWPLDRKKTSKFYDYAGIAGWTDDGTLIFHITQWIPDSGSRQTFWRLVPGQEAEQFWEGNLWPYRVNQYQFRNLVTVIPRRNSIVVPSWSGPDPSNSAMMNRVTLQEIFLDSGKSEGIADVPRSGVDSDTETRIFVWSDTVTDLIQQSESTAVTGSATAFESASVPESAAGSESTRIQYFLNVLNLDTREIRKIETSRIYQPDVSPNGRWVAARRIGDDDPLNGRLVLIDLARDDEPMTEGLTEPGHERMMEQTVSHMSWTKNGQLLIISADQKELGRLDPQTGNYTRILLLKGDRL